MIYIDLYLVCLFFTATIKVHYTFLLH